MSEERLNEIGNSIISVVENLFGQREKTTFHGFKYWGEDKEPELRGYEKSGYTIYISGRAKTNEIEANFQISHEVIHLLSPTTWGNVSVLEEGLATYYSIFHLNNINQSEAEKYLKHLENNNKYYQAYEKIKQIDGNIFSIVKRVREENPQKKISDIESDDLKSFISSEELRIGLTMRFNNQ